MFKKKPQIKNLSPLRSSDRRKLADQIIADYEIPIPSQPEPTSNPTPDQTSTTSDEPNQPPAPTLSTLRTSLLPESCLSARFTTTSGPTSTLVSGTIYVGAQPHQDERVLWIQFGQDKRLYPTVYTLWQNPGIVPLLHTPGIVVEKLKGGADLMVPGLIGGPPWPRGAKKGSVVAVAGVGEGRESVPVWVGVCEIDVCDLGDVRGARGRAVSAVHWAGDEIWSWNTVTGQGGGEVPQVLEGWERIIKGEEQNGGSEEVAKGIDNLDIEEEDEDAQDDGGVALGEPSHDAQSQNGRANEDVAQGEEDMEPSTAEIDAAFNAAFLYAVHTAKKQNPPPKYGLDLPIQPSYLISHMIQPYLRTQNQHYTIKKTSWKNTKKFIKSLDKSKIVRSKDRNGGETVILDIDFEDQQLKDFAPYKLPKANTATDSVESSAQNHPNNVSGGSTDQSFNLTTLIRPSPKLVPDLLPSKTHFYTAANVASYLKTYISNHPELTTNTSSPRNIKMDPFIANNILGSNTTTADTKSLAAGEIARDTLLKRIVDDHNLCPVYWVLLRPDQTWDPEDSSLPKPKPGPLPKVNIIIEKRTGSKLVTKISNLETFGINPSVLAPELQRKCAGSASVGQLMGGKPGTLEILVQGDQRDVVTSEIAKRGVLKSWVEVVDKSKKGKGGASGGVGGGGGGGRR